jgi:hypothetical protein
MFTRSYAPYKKTDWLALQTFALQLLIKCTHSKGFYLASAIFLWKTCYDGSLEEGEV